MRILAEIPIVGKPRGAHKGPTLSKSTNANTQPRRTCHRRTIRVNNEIVESEIMKTPAIFIPYIFSNLLILVRLFGSVVH